jgi:hypothetical protein
LRGVRQHNWQQLLVASCASRVQQPALCHIFYKIFILLGTLLHSVCRLHASWLPVCPAARELVREVDYTLKTLSKNLLGQDRTEVPSTGT